MEEQKPLNEKGKVKRAVDEQTGKTYKLVPETEVSIVAATFSGFYLIAMLVFFCWQFLDIVSGQNLLLTLVLPHDTDYLNTPQFRLIAYTVIGGGLGGVINGIRSFIVWHPERAAFGWRFIWKYITLPFVGVVLAAMVYAIIHGGIAVVGGSYVPGDDLTTQSFSAFAIGALTGYGSHKVFVWLDKQVNKLFRTIPAAAVKVPDLEGKTQKEAEDTLKECNLILGKVDKKAVDEPAKVDKVIDQTPAADSMISKGESVDIVIGTKT